MLSRRCSYGQSLSYPVISNRYLQEVIEKLNAIVAAARKALTICIFVELCADEPDSRLDV